MLDGMERGWMWWYNKVGLVGFRITIKVSYSMTVVEKGHCMQ